MIHSMDSAATWPRFIGLGSTELRSLQLCHPMLLDFSVPRFSFICKIYKITVLTSTGCCANEIITVCTSLPQMPCTQEAVSADYCFEGAGSGLLASKASFTRNSWQTWGKRFHFCGSLFRGQDRFAFLLRHVARLHFPGPCSQVWPCAWAPAEDWKVTFPSPGLALTEAPVRDLPCSLSFAALMQISTWTSEATICRWLSYKWKESGFLNQFVGRTTH